MPGQNYSAETPYAGWSPDPETGELTEMWMYTPKFTTAPTPELQKKINEWAGNKNISQKISNPLGLPLLAAEYKAPAPHVQQSQFDRASRGITLPYGDQFSGSWNAAMQPQQQYKPIQKPAEKHQQPITDNPTYSPGYNLPVGIGHIDMHPATDQAWQNNYQFHAPEAKKNQVKKLQPKNKKKHPGPAHPAHPAAKGKQPQSIAANEAHAKHHKTYHITINEVRGSHIETQHKADQREHPKVSSEALAGLLNAAVTANQLHAG